MSNKELPSSSRGVEGTSAGKASVGDDVGGFGSPDCVEAWRACLLAKTPAIGASPAILLPPDIPPDAILEDIAPLPRRLVPNCLEAPTRPSWSDATGLDTPGEI